MICEIIRGALWNAPLKKHTPEEWAETYREVKMHRIELLFVEALSRWKIPADIRNTWKLECYAITSHNVQLLTLQREIHELLLKEKIEYSVIKGSAAAVYYPNPLFRTAGDIDIIVRDEDFERTQVLFENLFGAPFIGSKHNGRIREYVYMKDLCTIELHQSYAILENSVYDRMLDSWIKEDCCNKSLCTIGEKYQLFMPSECVNGLILLSHIAQHLEGGLGLRQIIDWMMYVEKCLPDEKWQVFQGKARKIGLEDLAITTTRMCQLYLGLPTENKYWTERADLDLCNELMEFILDCGDFGIRHGMDNTVSMIVSQNQGAFSLFKNLQLRGVNNWKTLKKHSYLKPFAWIYQSCRYIRKGMERKNPFREFRKDYVNGKRRNKLLKKLGVKKK